MAPVDFVVAIPSLRRVKILRRYTYQLLSPALRAVTHVFAQSAEDFAAYRAAFPDLRIVRARRKGQWVEGYGAVVHFMRRYFPIGMAVLYLHDDVRGLFRMRVPSLQFTRVSLRQFARRLIAAVTAVGGCLGGVYSNQNPFYMKMRPAITSGTVFIYDPVHVDLNRRLPGCVRASKCDYETSAEARRVCGPNVRFNHYCARTWHKPLGRSGWRRTPASLLRDTLDVLRRYPDFYCGYRWRGFSGDTSLQVRPGRSLGLA